MSRDVLVPSSGVDDETAATMKKQGQECPCSLFQTVRFREILGSGGVGGIVFRPILIDLFQCGIARITKRQRHRPLGGGFGLVRGNGFGESLDGSVFDRAFRCRGEPFSGGGVID